MNVLIRRSMARRARQYLLLPATAGNYPSTPTNAAIDAVTTDFTLVACLEQFNPATGTVQAIACKRAAAGTAALTQWQLRFDATGELRLVVSNGVSTGFGGASTIGFPAGSNWMKATFDADNGAVGATTRFWHAASRSFPSAWTQLGNDVVGTLLLAIAPNAQPFTLGVLSDDGAANRLSGRVRYASFAGGIDGAPVSEFDPTRFVSGNSLQARTGEVWTINRSGGNPARVAA